MTAVPAEPRCGDGLLGGQVHAASRSGFGDSNPLPFCRIPGPRPVHEGITVKALVTPQAGVVARVRDRACHRPQMTSKAGPC